MRVFVLALGTRGDFELFLRLGRQLSRRGHEVVIGTSAFYATEVHDARLQSAPIGQGTKEELVSVLHSVSSIRDKAQRTYQYCARWLRPQLGSSNDQIRSLAARTDYFVSGLKLILRRANQVIPSAAVTYDLPGDIAELSKSPTRELHHDGPIVELVAMSKRLIDPDDQWGDDYHFTGFWASGEHASWEPRRDLLEFLERGPRPVVITLGSMIPRDGQQFLGVIRQSLNISGQRAVLIRGWSGISPGVSDELIHCADEVPYEWLFPRASCVIHHGGCGTVTAVLRAGKPSIVLPQITSQAHFGRMLAQHKLATGVFDLEDLDANELAEAIDAAIHDDQTLTAASIWRQTILQEPGVTAAVELIEAHWAKSRS
jgi:UDP:flavonoid glycosyltransferase YjiC (YdhE family)